MEFYTGKVPDPGHFLSNPGSWYGSAANTSQNFRVAGCAGDDQYQKIIKPDVVTDTLSA
jgi:hypothetical protein